MTLRISYASNQRSGGAIQTAVEHAESLSDLLERIARIRVPVTITAEPGPCGAANYVVFDSVEVPW